MQVVTGCLESTRLFKDPRTDHHIIITGPHGTLIVGEPYAVSDTSGKTLLYTRLSQLLAEFCFSGNSGGVGSQRLPNRSMAYVQ